MFDSIACCKMFSSEILATKECSENLLTLSYSGDNVHGFLDKHIVVATRKTESVFRLTYLSSLLIDLI
jgi:hypothetical protein